MLVGQSAAAGQAKEAPMAGPDKSRRSFVKRATYVTPAIVTLAAAPSFAKAGSYKATPDKLPKLPKPKKGG
jgi:hypothetical protein